MTTSDIWPVRLPLLGLEGIQLKNGGHASRADGVCAMEAVAWIAGESHSDKPTCACPVIGAFMRNWNDSLPDDDTRTRVLRPLLPVLVGTKATPAIELQRSWMAIDWLAREHAPAWLSLRNDLKAHAVALRGLAPITDRASAAAAQPTLAAAGAAARAAAGAAARAAAAWDAARAAAWAAAWAAARAAAWAAAAGAAARAAAWDAAWDTARAAAAGDAARAAAWAALQRTVVALQQSASELVRRMAAITAEVKR